MVAVALVMVGTSGCSGSGQHHLTVEVNHGPVAFDAPLGLTVGGADPHRSVRITATATDAGTASWQAHADYKPSAQGTVDVRTSPAGNGSYQGAHDTGLLWSMTAGSSHPQFSLPENATMTVTFTASQDGAATASAQQRRWFRAPDVRMTTADRAKAGFVGTLYSPAHPSPATPAVMVLGGSEGGLPASQPAALASRGHVALAVAYFGLPGLPKTLTRIPLEYFATALRWLGRQPGVDPHRITVMGTSRGSEAALLVGVHYPELVHSVAALSPSSVVNPAPRSNQPAWTWHGQPLPTVSTEELGQPTPRDTRAIIGVERVRGPVFLLCGDQDQLWPSCPFSEAIAHRLGEHAHTEVRESAAGHLVGFVVPNLPEASNAITFNGYDESIGGTVQDDALGRLDAWPKLLSFLAR
jgi:dienelactone hydrolase